MVSNDDSKIRKEGTSHVQRIKDAGHSAAKLFSRRKYLLGGLVSVALVSHYLAAQSDAIREELIRAEKEALGKDGYPGIEPDTISSRPLIHRRFQEMASDAELEGVTLCVSKMSKEISKSLGSLPWISCIGNKVIISQNALDLLTDREVVAVLGHELGHLKHNKEQIASLLLPEEISFGVATAAGMGTLIASDKLYNKSAHEEKPRLFSRRNLLKAAGAALTVGGTTEFAITRTDTRRRMQRRNEYMADAEALNLSGDKNALIDAFFKM